MLILAIEAFAIVSLVPSQWVQDAAEREYELIADHINTRTADSIYDRATRVYTRWFVDSGIVQGSYNLYVPTEEQKRRSLGIETMGSQWFEIVQERITTFWSVVFCAVERAIAVGLWLPFVLPFIGVAIYDGLVLRRIKLVTFGMTSAPIFGGSAHALLLAVFSLLYYLIAPVAISPLFLPIWMLVVGVLLHFLFANFQRI